MDLRSKLQAATKDAMRAKETERLSALRMISAKIKDREIAARGEGQELGEADLLALLGAEVKKRQESAKVYEQGGRPELAAKELAEVGIIQEFMPRQMDEAEIAEAVSAVVTELEANSLRDMGRVMAALRDRYLGQMDFAAAGAVVKARLSA